MIKLPHLSIFTLTTLALLAGCVKAQSSYCVPSGCKIRKVERVELKFSIRFTIPEDAGDTPSIEGNTLFFQVEGYFPDHSMDSTTVKDHCKKWGDYCALSLDLEGYRVTAEFYPWPKWPTYSGPYENRYNGMIFYVNDTRANLTGYTAGQGEMDGTIRATLITYADTQ